MATLNVSLPDPMKDWVDSRTQDGRYSDASDYVRELIKRDQEKANAIAELDLLIEEGFESGISDRSIQEVFAEAREEAKRLGIV